MRGGERCRGVGLVSFIFQAEDGIRDPLWSRGLGDVYKGQDHIFSVVYGEQAFVDLTIHELTHDMRHAAGFPCH